MTHINSDGEFQSDKYPWCKAGFVPLKLTDPHARLVLEVYSELHMTKDPEFATDLLTCIRKIRYGN